MSQDTNLYRLVTVEEAADLLKISPRTIYNAVAPKAKKPFPVKALRMGKLVRFLLKDVIEYMESL